MSEHDATCLRLPLFEVPPTYLGKSQRIRQRHNKRRLTLIVANSCLTSLNHLSSNVNIPVDNQYLQPVQRVCVRGGVFSSSSNNAAMFIPAVFSSSSSTFNSAQIQRTVQFVLAASKVFVNRVDLDSGGDIVTRQSITYSDCASLAVPLQADKVALPEQAGVVQLLDLLPPHLASKFVAPSSELLVDAAPSMRVPGMLMASQDEYLKLIRRMMSANMVRFTTTPKCVNGIFCVTKDRDSLRLIINAQPANSVFAKPPPVELPTPDLIANLVLDLAADLFVAKVDISNFYHQLALPLWMHEYFALPAVSARDLDLQGFGDAHVFPCCTTLPMGFSWSVFLAQSAHEHMLYTETSIRREDALSKANDSLLTRVRHTLYIDDLSFLGVDKLECLRQQDEYMAACVRCKLPVKMSKVVRPSSQGVEVIGVLVDGQQHTVGVSARKLATLVSDTLKIIHDQQTTGVAVEQLIGRWSWAFLVRRPAFAVFSAVYRFAAVAGRRKFSLWQSVENELLIACGLVPLLCTSLVAPVLGRLVAFDASSSGQGVVAAKLPVAVAERVADHLSVHPAPVLTRVAERLVKSQRWSTIVAAPWESDEHINVKESRAGLSAVRWIASLPSAMNRRVLLLTDSAVVSGILSKGRSSAFTILRIVRLVSAVLFACNIQLFTRWVPSSLNPADLPSRLYE
jgi:hypothetical protein